MQNIKAERWNTAAAFVLALLSNVEEVDFNAYRHMRLADDTYFWPLFANAADLQEKGDFDDVQWIKAPKKFCTNSGV